MSMAAAILILFELVPFIVCEHSHEVGQRGFVSWDVRVHGGGDAVDGNADSFSISACSRSISLAASFRVSSQSEPLWGVA
jgi:hypothetical protein